MTEDSLFNVLRDIETHVARAGWDQPARLFALVETRRLVASEPSVAAALSESDLSSEGLSAVEQEGFTLGEDMAATFAQIMWGPAVAGCALAVERTMVPSEVEDDLPADPIQAGHIVASHPRRMDLRLVVGVLRDGSHHAIGRLAGSTSELLSGSEMVPGLVSVLEQTLVDRAE